MKTEKSRLSRLDILFLVLLFLSLGLYIKNNFFFQAHPFEDAAILMRYADHLSQGQGIVWNTGEAPVDGATDFLFLLVLGGLGALGIPMENAVRLVGISSHFLIVLLIYLGIRRVSRGPTLVALICTLFFAFGPGLGYSEAYFGTSFFALFVALTWLLALQLVYSEGSTRMEVCFALSALATGLIRPEGVLLAGFILLALLLIGGLQKFKRLLIIFLAVFLVAGGAYFLWRWFYFGYPLPNPFYKKGGGRLYLDSLQESIQNVLTLSGAFFWLYLIGFITFVITLPARITKQNLLSFLRVLSGLFFLVFLVGAARPSAAENQALIFGRYSFQYILILLALLLAAGLLFKFAGNIAGAISSRLVGRGWNVDINSSAIHLKLSINPLSPGTEFAESTAGLSAATALALIPIFGFTMIWILLSNEMNYQMRFQYPLLAIILLSTPVLWDNLITLLRIPKFAALPKTPRLFLGMIAILLFGGILLNQFNLYKDVHQGTDGRYNMAVMLQDYQKKGYTMVVTEAGLLPYYSGWKTIDAWGLNDQWISHNGQITPEYLDKFRPELIAFHADFSPISPPDDSAVPANPWAKMVMTLKKYAEDNQYILAASLGDSPFDTHYYYVKKDCPDASFLVKSIRSVNYSGRKGFNFADLEFKQ